MGTERTFKRRLLPAAITALLVIGGLSSLGSSPATAAPGSAPGTISTWAGGTGEGPALNISVDPGELAAHGPFVYIADNNHNTVRALDTRTGVLQTIAGNGDPSPWASNTPPGDGGLATASRIANPTGLAVDSTGRVYIADYEDSRVRRVDLSGVITTFARINPYGLASDAAGNLFVNTQSEIRKISASGTSTTIAGAQCSCVAPPPEDVVATEAVIHARGVAVDGTGHLHLTHQGQVLKIDDDGILRRVAGGGAPADGLGDGGPATIASLGEPAGIAFDSAGNLFIAETVGNRVRKVDSTGVITTVAGGGAPADDLGDGGLATEASLSRPAAVVIGAEGALYVSDTYHQRLRKVSGGVITTAAGWGRGGYGGDGGQATKAQLVDPWGMVRDRSGNTYVVERDPDRVRKIDAAGVVSTVAGSAGFGFSGDGGPALTATLRAPQSVAVDHEGNIFIADSANGRVRKVDGAGVITTVAGGGTAPFSEGVPATAIALSSVAAVAVDAGGSLYLSDRDNRRIMKVTRAGTITTFAGGVPRANAAPRAGDGGPATSATLGLSQAVTLAFDSTDQLHISDADSGTVRKVDLAGVITTVAGGAYSEGPAIYGQQATSLRFLDLGGIAFDSKGNLFLVDGSFSRVLKVDTTGRTSIVAGTDSEKIGLGDGGPALQARINAGAGSGLAFDGLDNLYIADSRNRVIRRIEAAAVEDGTDEGGGGTIEDGADEGEFHALTPARILDTRDGTGGFSQPLGPASTISAKVTGLGGVPEAGVSAVVLNVTVTQPTAGGYLTVFPSGSGRPFASNLNFVAGLTVPNLVVAKVGADTRVSIYNSAGTTHVIADVVGWYSSAVGPPGARYSALTPARILDTRDGTGGFRQPLGPASTISAKATGLGGVPETGVSAVVLNVTVTEPTTGGYLTVFPSGSARPFASNLNFVRGLTVPNLVVAKVGADTKVNIYNSAGNTQVIADVVGWFGIDGAPGGSAYNPLVPARVLDTRDATGGFIGPAAPGATLSVTIAGQGGVPPTGATAVILNVTATQPTAGGYLTVFPSGAARPLASNLNVVTGQTVPNLVVAGIGPDGKVNIYNGAGATHVIFDVVGWYGA